MSGRSSFETGRVEYVFEKQSHPCHTLFAVAVDFIYIAGGAAYRQRSEENGIVVPFSGESG